MGDDLDNRALPAVKIDVIMGRNAGFLTAAAVLGRKKDDDGPHLIYIPERCVTMDKFLADVNAVYSKLGRCVIAVSEGMCDVDGVVWTKKITETAEKDAHGNIQLSGTGALADFLAAQIKNNLKIKRVRADTFGYLQRSFAGLQSSVDAKEARLCGRQAVKYAVKQPLRPAPCFANATQGKKGSPSGSVAIRRLKGAKYKSEMFATELSSVAEKTKSMPAEFINAEGNGVTQAFVNYAMPLTGMLPKTEHLLGCPRI
jgi:6-phosphofructokinase 1